MHYVQLNNTCTAKISKTRRQISIADSLQTLIDKSIEPTLEGGFNPSFMTNGMPSRDENRDPEVKTQLHDSICDQVIKIPCHKN